MAQMTLRQIIYVSRARSDINLDQVLLSSKNNNAIDGVSGLLWVDDLLVVQVIEGPDESVVATFDRIKVDERHTDVAVVSDRTVSEREFGYWSMELRRRGQPIDDLDRRLRRKLSGMPRDLHTSFAAHFGTRS
ncbi:BLUF domain-containing protein [Sphingomonas sp. BIUV-7]|uniref:BLUF domain-containing protein n=1 Tax=Sphingomonas natans TaxID=3063330 RepID=A0ABT8Y6Z5_9SPHN|nr:BLUF domain-containing protein [Sphingomonas sp. BIUV-7]MDO6414097.1 BLUF domain-containing protein [Sphingomonas sp. BIUV-7]